MDWSTAFGLIGTSYIANGRVAIVNDQMVDIGWTCKADRRMPSTRWHTELRLMLDATAFLSHRRSLPLMAIEYFDRHFRSRHQRH